MNFFKLSVGALALALNGAAVANADAPVSVTTRTLAAHIANQIVVAAVNECSKRGFKVSSAVVGRDGNLQAYLRDPLSGPHTVLVSQRKAYSAATLQAPTSQMASRQDLNFAPGILLIVGGVPINVGGVFYGGVAVAGADPEVDEQCAQAGVDAVTEALEFAQ